VKWPRLLLLAAVAALGVWAWTALHPSPERLIRKQLEGVARAVSFRPNEGYLAKLAGARSLPDFFSTNVEINIDLPGRQEHRLAGREEIQQAALAARTGAGDGDPVRQLHGQPAGAAIGPYDRQERRHGV